MTTDKPQADLISRAAALEACRAVRLHPDNNDDVRLGAIDCQLAIADLPAAPPEPQETAAVGPVAMRDRRPSLSWIIGNTSQVRVRDLALEIFNDLDAHIRSHTADAGEIERLRSERERDEAVAARTSRPVGWRVFESAYRGNWGIEVDGDNDADPVLHPVKIDRHILDIVARAHNSALTPPPDAGMDDDTMIAAMMAIEEMEHQEGWFEKWRVSMPSWKGEHFGDCTNQPISCLRCQYDEAMKRLPGFKAVLAALTPPPDAGLEELVADLQVCVDEYADTVPSQKLLRDAITALRSRPAGMVNGLVWEDCTFAGQPSAYADTEFGPWMVTSYSGRAGRWAYTDPIGEDSEDDWGTRAEAQAAAQADHAARIRAALSDAPAQEGG